MLEITFQHSLKSVATTSWTASKSRKVIRTYTTVVYREYTIALQALLDRAHGELPSDIQTLISHWEIFHGKIGEIWRSAVATYTESNHFAVTQSSAILEL